MLTTTGAFSGYSADDTERLAVFYRDTLGLDVRDAGMGGIIALHVTGGAPIIVYPKGEDHVPASYTVLNLEVADIDQAVAELAEAGVELIRYEGSGQDEHGVMRSTDPAEGPTIGWFADPAGNIISLIEG
ncbi:VOC family protein [Homoserinibacter sp. YIM 151385]|uniref:VOC family protein n=1 Tax=Homoserinibacter sp. YIM 151385 TaxID=2985506 RepID=UPI0022F0E8BD|nr:VOC family protein [Homoserinibacter sp. YIM 151385]WBU39080.1 VOC family protein [Homoserinibacter sp. YIM 151385]